MSSSHIGGHMPPASTEFPKLPSNIEDPHKPHAIHTPYNDGGIDDDSPPTPKGKHHHSHGGFLRI